MASSNIWMKSLKWINHKESLVEVLSNVRSRDAFCDASISCDGKFYSVHKLVMSACSDYLRELFEKVTKFSSNTTYPVIVLNEIQHQHLENLLDLIYLGTVDVEQSDIPNLIKVAKCLQFKGLSVTNEFSEASSTHNVCEETNDTEWSRYDVANDDWHGDDCIDPLALDSSAVAEDESNVSRLHSIQDQRTGGFTNRHGRKWQPGGRGRPPKNISYRNVDPGIHQNRSFEPTVSRLNAVETNNLNVEALSAITRVEEVQSARRVECPICHGYFPFNKIETHASSCNSTSSKTALRSYRLPSNESHEIQETERPADRSMQANEKYKGKGPNLIPRKKRRKGIRFTSQSLIRKRKEYLKNYYANQLFLKNSSKVPEKTSAKVSKNIMKKKSELILDVNSTSKANDNRPAMANAVIPKVKRPVGRPPKKGENKKKEIYIKKVSLNAKMVGKDLPYSTTTRTEDSCNPQDKCNAKRNVSGSTHFRRPSTADPNVFKDSLYTDFEWNEAPGKSEIIRSIKVEKEEKTDLLSSLWSNEQFADMIIKEEQPDEDRMFRIESVTTLNNHTEEGSERNHDDNADENIITDDNKLSCDARSDRTHDDNADENIITDVNKLSYDEVVKPFGSRTKRCRRCAGCKTKENCGECVSCNRGIGTKYIRCQKRQCKRLKRIKEKNVKNVKNVKRIKEENLVRCKTNIGVEDISGTKVEHELDTVTCRICSKQYSGKNCKNMLYRHGLVHRNQQRYSCTSCNYSAYYLWQIKAHKEKKHNNAPISNGNRPRLQCPECQFTCLQKTYMKKHALKYHNERPDDNFGSKILNAPVPIKRKPEHPLSCNTCGKLFQGPHKVRQFKIHNYYHKRKILICPHCPYHCYRKAFLDAHIKKKHPGAILNPKIRLPQIRLERLPEDILNMNVLKKNLKPSDETLKKENNIQTDEQRVKSLTALSGRDAWFALENGKCLLCDREYKFLSQFITHWRSHTGEKPYTCSVCPYRSKHAFSLNFHINKYHKIDK